MWVGIDGDNGPGLAPNGTVEQIGTAAKVVNGQTQYVAWWEFAGDQSAKTGAKGPGFFPQDLPTSFAIHPGDTISASVTFVSSTSSTSTFFFQIQDTPKGGPPQSWHSELTTTNVVPARTTAEWIVENPNNGAQPLANFGQVSFTGAWATIGTKTGAIDTLGKNVALNMLSNGVQLDNTSFPMIDSNALGFNEPSSGSLSSSSFTVTLSPIGGEYEATANEFDLLGDNVQKLLGAPTSGVIAVPGVPGALMITFHGGTIYWSQRTGAHVLYGPILAEYLDTASETDANGTIVQKLLGLPTSDEMNVPGVLNAGMNTFQGGTIYLLPDNSAHVLYGPIAAKYNSVGGPAGYGLPISDEGNVPGVPGVRVDEFQNGRAIFWSEKTGAHLVYGSIFVEYLATANETDAFGNNVLALLGAPTGDEMNVPGVPGARMNTFQGGTIYWSPSPGIGAHVVYGAINTLYQRMGGPTSYLGLPTSDESDDLYFPGVRVTYFQNGTIEWSLLTGAWAKFGF